MYAGDVEYTSSADGQAFGAWLAAQPHTHKVVTFGNMDSFGPKRGASAALLLLLLLCGGPVGGRGLCVHGAAMGNPCLLPAGGRGLCIYSSCRCCRCALLKAPLLLLRPPP